MFVTPEDELREKQRKLINVLEVSESAFLPVESRIQALDQLAGNEIRNIGELVDKVRDQASDKAAEVEKRDQAEQIETRAAIVAEQRSAIAANPVAVPGGDREIRGGELLGAEVRAVNGSAGMGQAFTPAENASFMLDFLAKNAVFLRTGVQIVRTTGDSIVIPHLTSDGTAAAVAEATALPVSDPVAESLTAVPRKFAQSVRVSNEVLADAKPSTLEALANSLIRATGLAFDKSAFEGTGTAPDVRGLKNVAGIQSLSMGANGLALSNLDSIADALGMLADANANDEAAVIVMPGRTWRAIMKLKEATGSNKSLIQESAGSASDGVTRRLFGRPVYLSGNLSVTETQGTSNAASSIWVYDPSQLYAVIREDTVFDVNPYVYGPTDETLVRAILRADVLCPNPTAIVRVVGVL